MQQQGADFLYAPGIKTNEEIAAVVEAVPKPVNLLIGFSEISLTRAKELGVRRISLGARLHEALGLGS